MACSPGEVGRATETDCGVHVGGIWKGVIVASCSEGPRGLFHVPEYNQNANANKAMAITDKIERTVF